MSNDPIVYVLDDDRAVRASLETLIESAGYAVQTFSSEDEYLARERVDAPSCLVLDVRLKGRSGLEIHRELVREGDTQPIIFITGHGDIQMSVAAMKAGAVEFLTKPFRDQDLLDAVCSAISRDVRQCVCDPRCTDVGTRCNHRRHGEAARRQARLSFGAETGVADGIGKRTPTRPGKDAIFPPMEMA